MHPSCSKWQRIPLSHFGIRKELWFWLVFLVSIPSNKSGQLKKKGEIIDGFLLVQHHLCITNQSWLILTTRVFFLENVLLIRSQQENKNSSPEIQPHWTTIDKDCPCKVTWCQCASCRAHSWWQNRNRSNKNWKPSTPFILWMYGYQDLKTYSECFSLCYLHSEPFNDCSEAGCHNNGCFQSYLPSSFLLVTEKPVPDASQGKICSHSGCVTLLVPSHPSSLVKGVFTVSLSLSQARW